MIDEDLEIKSEETSTEISIPDDNAALLDEAAKRVSMRPLIKKQDEILANILNAEDKETLDRQFELFNLNQNKKNALRVVKLENLLSKIEDQALYRITKRPDLITNRELVDYMGAVSTQIERAGKRIDSLQLEDPIQVLNKTDVKINIQQNNTTAESKEHIMDAVSKILQQLKTTEQPSSDEYVVVNEDENKNEEIK